VEYTSISQVAPEKDGADEEPVEQSPLSAEDNDVEVDNDNLDADHVDDVLLCFRSINDILRTVEFAPCALVAEEVHVVSYDVVSSDGLTSFNEVERSPSWRKVMMEEITSIKENITYSLIDLSSGRKLIGVKWVLKVKLAEKRVMSKHKARLVVNGYT
jgi:hypothetical protein